MDTESVTYSSIYKIPGACPAKMPTDMGLIRRYDTGVGKVKEGHIKMKVYGFKETGHGIMEIGDDTEVFHEFVGGQLEAYCIGNGLYVILNEEGRLEELSPRAVHYEWGNIMQVIVGDCFVCRFDDNGMFSSVREDDIKYINKRLIPVMEYMN